MGPDGADWADWAGGFGAADEGDGGGGRSDGSGEGRGEAGITGPVPRPAALGDGGVAPVTEGFRPAREEQARDASVTRATRVAGRRAAFKRGS